MTTPDRSAPLLPIAAVERETGLSKDTLRVWERRYGFPLPERNPIGDRLYPADQVERLRLIRGLLDRGHRAGRVVTLPVQELRALQQAGQQASLAPQMPLHAAAAPGLLAAQDAAGAIAGASTTRASLDWLALLRSHDVQRLRGALRQQLLTLGLARFTVEVMAPLTRWVGAAWATGEIEVYEEHLFTEAAGGVMREALLGLQAMPQQSPRVLLSTFPGELHGLGLLMVEALLGVEGAYCFPLGVQTPLSQVAQAVAEEAIDVVALSFTPVLAAAQVQAGLAELRAQLPAAVEIWAGGASPALRRISAPGVQLVTDLELIGPEVARWRQRRTV